VEAAACLDNSDDCGFQAATNKGQDGLRIDAILGIRVENSDAVPGSTSEVDWSARHGLSRQPKRVSEWPLVPSADVRALLALVCGKDCDAQPLERVDGVDDRLVQARNGRAGHGRTWRTSLGRPAHGKRAPVNLDRVRNDYRTGLELWEMDSPPSPPEKHRPSNGEFEGLCYGPIANVIRQSSFKETDAPDEGATKAFIACSPRARPALAPRRHRRSSLK
jgi:hypothetical protein